MKLVALIVPMLLTLTSCSSPPKPPTVDESHRRPANAGVSVELQTCKGELQNTRILATEKSRDANATRSAFLKLVAQRQPQAAPESRADDMRSTVYTIIFPFGGSSLALSRGQEEQLVREARAAPLILLSGRTDGVNESPAESRIARERSEAVRSLLVAAGVSPARIRSTWQPVGDHAAENTSAEGRSLNRRVEIEIYRSAPRVAQLADAQGQTEDRHGGQ